MHTLKGSKKTYQLCMTLGGSLDQWGKKDSIGTIGKNQIWTFCTLDILRVTVPSFLKLIIVSWLCKKMSLFLAGVAQWIEHRLWTKGSPVRSPVRAHAWVAGQVPSGGYVRGNQTLMFLSLSFSLSSLLSKINK